MGGYSPGQKWLLSGVVITGLLFVLLLAMAVDAIVLGPVFGMQYLECVINSLH